MDNTGSHLRWGVGQRLEFIEFRLYWEGQINRGDLMQRFGISTPQATSDLGRYQSLAPRNVRYDPRLRTYVAAPEFSPVLYEPSARQYLADLRAIADDAVEKQHTWLGTVPGYAVTPTPRRRLEPHKLRTVLEAIRGQQALRVVYQSLTRPSPTDRWLTPHALAYDGARWHVRAWCDTRKEFRDFLLARMLTISEGRYHPINAQHDLEWNREVTLRIGPRPELPEHQRHVLELEFGMEGGFLEISLRLRMAYYLERNLLLDKAAAKLPPERAQLTLLNRDEVSELRRRTEREQGRINQELCSPREMSVE